jgi:hypothetical protein
MGGKLSVTGGKLSVTGGKLLVMDGKWSVMGGKLSVTDVKWSVYNRWYAESQLFSVFNGYLLTTARWEAWVV